MAKKVNTYLELLTKAGFNIPTDISFEKQDYKELVFNMDNINNFIKLSVKLILSNIKELIIK